MLVTHSSSYQYPPTQTRMISISTINYRKTIFEHKKLTTIMGVPDCDTLKRRFNRRMRPNIDNKINLICKTIELIVDPPPPNIVSKDNTGAT